MLALAVTSANAQSVRSDGMGQVMLAVGADGAAWWHNVALTPLIPLWSPERDWGGMGQVTRALTSGVDWTTVDFSMRSADGVQGFGAGIRGGGGWSDIGAGYARTWMPGFTGGVSLGYRSGGVDDFWWTAAVAYEPPMNDGVIVRVAAEYWNMIDGGYGQWNVGAGAIWPNGLTIGVDGVDLSEDAELDLGAEWAMACGGRLRAGLIDVSDAAVPTAGVAYARGPWELGVAWQNWPGDDYWAVGGSGSW